METDYKLSRREKVRLVTSYLRGCWGYFEAALLCACLSMSFKAWSSTRSRRRSSA